jgi:hypothetical protein
MVSRQDAAPTEKSLTYLEAKDEIPFDIKAEFHHLKLNT